MEHTRELVLISGLPGSGKSRLGRSIAETLHRPGKTVEHISFGDTVRDIGSLAIHSVFEDTVVRHLNSPHHREPLSDDVAVTIAGEALLARHNTDLILLDGYPRNLAQYADIGRLALAEDRRIRGMIVTEASEEDMLSRLIMRTPRNFENDMSPSIARERLVAQRDTLQQLYRELTINPLYRCHLQYVDTHGSKSSSTEQGLLALQEFCACSEQ